METRDLDKAMPGVTYTADTVGLVDQCIDH